jgi:hypothetical protein
MRPTTRGRMSLPSTALRVEPLLFNDPRYLDLHAPAGARALVLAHEADGRATGAIAGVLDEGRFTSGYSAPFGGVDLAPGLTTPGAVVATVDGLVAQLDATGVLEATVRCRPACHGAAEDVVRFALLGAGFAVTEADLSFTLPLVGLDDAGAWLAARKRPLRRAVRDADPSRFTFADATDWSSAFAVLEANRAARGRTLSVGLERVLAVREAFGDRIRLAELRHDDGPPVAAALTYRVTAATEFVVAWGDAGHALETSPMPVLVLRLVERALAEGVSALDLGTSTLVAADGRRVPNDGLVQFKRAVGASAELRPVLTRSRP